MQINPKIKLDFARILRTALRQDPDIIMIGEMRDQETAEIGLRAAMTGHMVLSTLHTNDAISTAVRLTDMGADAFLVASSLRAVVGQRLVRKICSQCKTSAALNPQERAWLAGISAADLETQFYVGRGCHHCNNTGYVGRTGVYELLELDEHMLDALRRHDASGFIHAAHNNPYYLSLTMCALTYARAGITSMQEVFKISATLEDRATLE